MKEEYEKEKHKVCTAIIFECFVCRTVPKWEKKEGNEMKCIYKCVINFRVFCTHQQRNDAGVNKTA